MTAPSYGNPPGQGPLRYGGVSVADVGTDDKNLPSTRSKASAEQMEELTLVRDLSIGNRRIKARGTHYLPQEPGEPPDAYRNRLNRSVLTNFFQRAIEGLTGLVYSKDPVFGDDVPAEIVEHCENIDLAGTHVDVFLRESFQDQLTAGHAGILVDYPETGGTQSAADERDPTFPVRPYWVPILKENIISWRTTTVNGSTVLAQIVFRECSMVPDGLFGEREITRYRVLNRADNGVVTWRLLEISEDRTVTLVGAGVMMNQNEIPFAELITSGRQSLLVSKPPLVDLAYLNIAHYQQDSDYANSRHKTCVPIWVETGVDVESDGTVAPIVLGPNTARRFTNPQATAQYVSHDGAALAENRVALENLKADMGTLSIQMLAPDKRAAETLGAKKLDKSAGDSALSVSVRGQQDGVERALHFHARYMKLPSGGSIKINRDFDNNVMDADTMRAYGDLADKLNIPVRTILEELQAGGRFVGQDLDQLEQDIEIERATRMELARIEAAAQPEHQPQNKEAA